MINQIEFFSLDKNFRLAKEIAESFEKTVFTPDVVRFSDSELRISFSSNFNIKNKSAVIIHSTIAPVSETLLQLLFLLDLLNRKGAKKIVVVIPYFGYSRQCVDKATGALGHASLVAKMIEVAGAGSVVSVEIHDKILESFFKIPFFNVQLHEFIARHIKKKCGGLDNCCLVAPDSGAADRVRSIAGLLELPALFFKKERCGPNEVKIVEVSGEFAGKKAIIIDDIIDTGSTAIQVSNMLVKDGISNVYGYFVHPVFSKGASVLKESSFEKVFVSNSIDLCEKDKIGMIEVFDISKSFVSCLTRFR